MHSDLHVIQVHPSFDLLSGFKEPAPSLPRVTVRGKASVFEQLSNRRLLKFSTRNMGAGGGSTRKVVSADGSPEPDW